MADVFALQRIHADVLFRNDDYVAAEKAKAIGRLLEHLRRELREVALPLVDAWNIPVRARSVLTHLHVIWRIAVVYSAFQRYGCTLFTTACGFLL